mmetsp:Transcript_49484/g.126060  ORF Transcript_49484/g.126060 Transcript_49484/m.126060 type:complete len:238 (-) Transcript_49484:550-1263(-)
MPLGSRAILEVALPALQLVELAPDLPKGTLLPLDVVLGAAAILLHLRVIYLEAVVLAVLSPGAFLRFDVLPSRLCESGLLLSQPRVDLHTLDSDDILLLLASLPQVCQLLFQIQLLVLNASRNQQEPVTQGLAICSANGALVRKGAIGLRHLQRRVPYRPRAAEETARGDLAEGHGDGGAPDDGLAERGRQRALHGVARDVGAEAVEERLDRAMPDHQHRPLAGAGATAGASATVRR